MKPTTTNKLLFTSGVAIAIGSAAIFFPSTTSGKIIAGLAGAVIGGMMAQAFLPMVLAKTAPASTAYGA